MFLALFSLLLITHAYDFAITPIEAGSLDLTHASLTNGFATEIFQVSLQ